VCENGLIHREVRQSTRIIDLYPAGKEIDVNHGIVDVFAFQEALLMEAVFGIALLAMIWVGFRRWLQHKEKMVRLLGEQAAELAAGYGDRIDRVEARLNGVEQIVADGTIANTEQVQSNRQIETDGSGD
jgi:hypothetical protein